MLELVVVVVSTSAATTILQGKKGDHFSTGAFSLHEGVILLQVEGVLSLRSGVISLRRMMTQVIPLRREMTHGSFCKGGGGGGVIFLRYTGSTYFVDAGLKSQTLKRVIRDVKKNRYDHNK